jgi:outer membrane protein TolC
MARRLVWTMLAALVMVGVARGAAPPAEAKVRLLSLREARALALERAGREAGVAKPAARDPEPYARDALRRCCAKGQLTHDQRRALYQALLNVEVAYWNLAAAYWSLYSRDQACRLAGATLDLVAHRFVAGKGRAADVWQARGQYALFLAQRRAALVEVRRSEQSLREILGMARGPSLIPTDTPSLIEVRPDWRSAVAEMWERRPELTLAREELEVANKQLGMAKLPIGFRAGQTDLRAAQLRLSTALIEMQSERVRALRYLGRQYEQLSVTHEQFRANRAQREAFGEQLRARQQEFLAGRGSLDDLLESQRFWADALANEFQQIVAYNNTLCAWDYARGHSLHRAQAIASKKPLQSADRERKRAEAAYQLRGAAKLRPEPALASLWKGVFVVPLDD